MDINMIEECENMLKSLNMGRTIDSNIFKKFYEYFVNKPYIHENCYICFKKKVNELTNNLNIKKNLLKVEVIESEVITTIKEEVKKSKCVTEDCLKSKHVKKLK